MASTERFLHEQRRLGNEGLLHGLEKNLIDLELLVNDLKTLAKLANLDNATTLHEVHQLEVKLFEKENAITEETIRIVNTAKHGPGSTTTTTVQTRQTTHFSTAKPSTVQPSTISQTKTTEKPSDDILVRTALHLIAKAEKVLAHLVHSTVEKEHIGLEVRALKTLIASIKSGHTKYRIFLEQRVNKLKDLLKVYPD